MTTATYTPGPPNPRAVNDSLALLALIDLCPDGWCVSFDKGRFMCAIGCNIIVEALLFHDCVRGALKQRGLVQ